MHGRTKELRKLQPTVKFTPSSDVKAPLVPCQPVRTIGTPPNVVHIRNRRDARRLGMQSLSILKDRVALARRRRASFAAIGRHRFAA